MRLLLCALCGVAVLAGHGGGYLRRKPRRKPRTGAGEESEDGEEAGGEVEDDRPFVATTVVASTIAAPKSASVAPSLDSVCQEQYKTLLDQMNEIKLDHLNSIADMNNTVATMDETIKTLRNEKSRAKDVQAPLFFPLSPPLSDDAESGEGVNANFVTTVPAIFEEYHDQWSITSNGDHRMVEFVQQRLFTQRERVDTLLRLLHHLQLTLKTLGKVVKNHLPLYNSKVVSLT